MSLMALAKQLKSECGTYWLMLQILCLALALPAESVVEAQLKRGWPIPNTLRANDRSARQPALLQTRLVRSSRQPIEMAWPVHAKSFKSENSPMRTAKDRRAKRDESYVCFKVRGFMGIGDRLRRTAWLAHLAWSRRQPLRLDLGVCRNHSIYGMLFEEHTGFEVPGLGQLIPWQSGETNDEYASECSGGLFGLNLLGPDQDVLPTDPTVFDQLHGTDAAVFLQPAVRGLVEALQQRLRPELHAMAARMVHKAREGDKKVIGVHLRIGNGEWNFKHDGRHIDLDDATIVARVKDVADLLARTRSWPGYRILLITDTPRVRRAWLKLHPDLVVVREEGLDMLDGQGFVEPHENQDPDLCRSSLEAAWVDATALGDVDVLLTPSWSELDLIPKTMVLSRGADWCRDAASYTLQDAGTMSFMQPGKVTCVSR